MTPEQLSLLAYLDQQQAELNDHWSDTGTVAKAEIINWLDADMPADQEVPDGWREFVSRIALMHLQRTVLPK